MKAKVVVSLLFIVLFIAGAFLIGYLMPQDDASLTIPYMEKVSLYIPPEMEVVEYFDASGMKLIPIEMAEYKAISLVNGNENFMSTSVLGGG